MKRLLPLLLLLSVVACQPVRPLPPLPAGAFSSPLPNPSVKRMAIAVYDPTPTPTAIPASRGIGGAFDSPLEPDVQAAADDVSHQYLSQVFRQVCYTSTEAAVFAEALLTDPRQQRRDVRCNPALVAAANARAYSLAMGGYWDHCDPAGVCPNSVARAAGCRLPADYKIIGNDIESLVAGSPDALASIDALSTSEKHADAIFARKPFFLNQREIGIGYYADPNSRFGFYFSIIFASCITSGE